MGFLQTMSLILALPLVAAEKGQAGRAEEAFVTCRLVFDFPKQQALEYVIRDAAMIEDLVCRPLRNAKRDPHPMDYKMYGTLELTRRNNSKEIILVFTRKGCIKRGNDYLIADLDELFEKMKEAVRRVAALP